MYTDGYLASVICSTAANGRGPSTSTTTTMTVSTTTVFRFPNRDDRARNPGELSESESSGEKYKRGRLVGIAGDFFVFFFFLCISFLVVPFDARQ